MTTKEDINQIKLPKVFVPLGNHEFLLKYAVLDNNGNIVEWVDTGKKYRQCASMTEKADYIMTNPDDFSMVRLVEIKV